MTDTATRTEQPRILQPLFPGVTTPVEYEIRVNYASESTVHQSGQFSTFVSGLDGVDQALRVFHSIAGTRRESGTLNLIAWSGADHDHAVGLIIAQHGWDRRDD